MNTELDHGADDNDAGLTVDLSGLPARRLQQKHQTPEVRQTVDDAVAGVESVTIKGDAWTERMVGPGEVEIRIAEGTPWTDPARTYRATFGEGCVFRDLAHVRQTLRDAVDINRLDAEYAERVDAWRAEQAVLDAIDSEPGLTTKRLQELVRPVIGGNDQDVRRIRTALFDREVITTTNGPHRSTLHHLGASDVVALARVEPGEVDDL